MLAAEERESIAEGLRASRLAVGHTQQSLAAGAGTSLQVVTQLEQGNITNPHLNTLAKLAKPLGVSIAYLAGEESAPKAPAPTSSPEVGAEPGVTEQVGPLSAQLDIPDVDVRAELERILHLLKDDQPDEAERRVERLLEQVA